MGEVGVDECFLNLKNCSSSSPPDPSSFSEECFSAAEEGAEQVVNSVHPTLDTEEIRRDVIDYIQRLIKTHLRCEVFPYGSVPLKTYLPDGDIDLTTLKSPGAAESLPRDVLAILEGEVQNEYAEYQVKDTQFIDAEVKLVKCFVRDIVIDISFNQLGGLSTLCFLEQVDRVVGKKHLFKRSIILVKSWCYYESRILGAHYGLISTYALETLVLYIFNMFHTSLSGPLAVLYKFLQYYSQFDWESYCISLQGPVCKSSLPDIVVKVPENGCNDLMLSEEFLENCMDMFSGPLRGLEEKPKAFQAKYLNIIDPLKENNNLGRSVHRGNFYRIRSAFKYGARKLGHVLSQPKDKVADGVKGFFANTLARHGNQHRISTRHLAFGLGDEESFTASLSSPVELFAENDNDGVGAENKSILMSKNELDRYSIREVDSETASEICYYADEVAISGNCNTGEAYDLATSNSSSGSGTSGSTLRSNYSCSISRNHCHKPSKSCAENVETENSRRSNLADTTSQNFGLSSWLEDGEKHGEINDTYQWCMTNSKALCITGPDSSTPKANILDSLSLDFREIDLASIEEAEAFNPLADLTGDYDSHIRSLLYGQLCHGVAISSPLAHNPPSFSSGVQCKKPWDIVRQSMPLRPNQSSLTNSYAFCMEQNFYHVADFALPAIAFHSEQKLKARGTGTYFPHTNGFLRDRPSTGRGRSKAPGNRNPFHRYARSNGVYLSSDDPNCFEKANQEVQHSRGRLSQGRGRSNLVGQSLHSVGDGNQTDDYISGSCRIEFGSVGNLAHEVIAGPANIRGSTPHSSLKTQGTAAVLNQERVPVAASMHLKNEDEFPPLCPLNA